MGNDKLEFATYTFMGYGQRWQIGLWPTIYYTCCTSVCDLALMAIYFTIKPVACMSNLYHPPTHAYSIPEKYIEQLFSHKYGK